MVFTFTLNQILAICAGLVVLSSAAQVVVNLIMKLKAPNKLQDDRLARLEKRQDELDTYIRNDSKRLAELEDGNRVTQQAILALLAHGIDGNEIESMRKAKDDLQQFLINRK